MGSDVFLKFGHALRAKRNELKLSQEEFGGRIGVARATVSNLENGENGPSDETLLRLEQEFGMDRQRSYELLNRVPPNDQPSPLALLEEIAALPDYNARMRRWAELPRSSRLAALRLAEDITRDAMQRLAESHE